MRKALDRMNKVDMSRYEDDSARNHLSDIYEVSNANSLIKFDKYDDDGKATAMKDVVKLFREPDTRKYVAKMGHLKIQIYTSDENDIEIT